jgi:hypothetical protein
MGNNFFAARDNILMKIHCMNAKKNYFVQGVPYNMGNNFFAARDQNLMKIHCMYAKKIILYRGYLIT